MCKGYNGQVCKIRQVISAEIETIKKYQTELLEIKDMVADIKNTFDELISRLKTP